MREITYKSKRAFLSLLAPVVLFCIGFAVVFFVKQKSAIHEDMAHVRQSDQESAPGITVGETVTLPAIANLISGDAVGLSDKGEKYILCAFFSVECPNCSIDTEFWKDLLEESGKRDVGFYLISVDDDQAGVKKFAQAHAFDDLPVYFDPHSSARESFKISIVPQYLLMSRDGRIVGRWNGVRRYNGKQRDFEKLAQLFQPIANDYR